MMIMIYDDCHLRPFLKTLEVSFMLPQSSIMLLENIHSACITYDGVIYDRHFL